jgi:hypothetical protein
MTAAVTAAASIAAPILRPMAHPFIACGHSSRCWPEVTEEKVLANLGRWLAGARHL